jgi:hypothetical protein
MAENRKPRELEERLMVERPKQWSQAETLPEPDKQPGYAYRWIRVSTLSVADPRNISGKFREGWEPVKASDHPEAQIYAEPNSRFKDAIEVGGLILCKTPVEFTEQRDAHYRKLADSQMTSVDNSFMRESDARMPLFNDRKSTVTRGRGFGSGS